MSFPRITDYDIHNLTGDIKKYLNNNPNRVKNKKRYFRDGSISLNMNINLLKSKNELFFFFKFYFFHYVFKLYVIPTRDEFI